MWNEFKQFALRGNGMGRPDTNTTITVALSR